MMTIFAKICVGFLIFIYLDNGVESKGCRDLYCCPGKNITCRGIGPRNNNPSSKICFCDEYCTNLGDCCTDYEDICRSVDCEISSWTHWSSCSSSCSVGKQTRSRQILRKSRNGGKTCPAIKDLKEVKSCHGKYSCRTTRRSKPATNQYEYRALHSKKQKRMWRKRPDMRETSRIIPAMYGTARKTKLYNPFMDIRKNLYHHHSANQIINRPAYHAMFVVSETRHRCNGTDATEWSKQLHEGKVTCVECQSFSMKRKIGVRCKGHGVYGQTTRWSALTIPGCHGKWKMVTQHKSGNCDRSKGLSFVLI